MTEPRPIYPKLFFREPVPRRETGFILMPFAEEFEPVHEAIREAIEGAGLSPLRADDIFNTRAGMEKILHGIGGAEVVVADMSGQNANVFYEAGIAHMAKENVVLLTRDRDDFPFDLQHIDHIVYEPTADGLRALTEKLQKVIESLAPEPPGGTLPPASSGDVRMHLVRLRKQCERDWREEVVPAMDKVFREEFGPRLQAGGRDEEVQAILSESIRKIQPAFLRSWQPIEEAGFQAIEQSEHDLWPSLFVALEWAYGFPARVARGAASPTVVGHGQLLTLRTWTLWGAHALFCENWAAVDTLLHKEASIREPGHSSPTVAPFTEYRHLYAPDAARSYYSPAFQSLYNHTEAFAERRFFDLADMQGYIGLWLFAAELAFLRGTGEALFPGWVFSPQDKFEELLANIERSDFSASFAQSVMNESPQSLNMRWPAIQEVLIGNRRFDIEYSPRIAMMRVPSRFAE